MPRPTRFPDPSPTDPTPLALDAWNELAAKEKNERGVVALFGWTEGNAARGDYGWWVPDASDRRGKRLVTLVPDLATPDGMGRVLAEMSRRGWNHTITSLVATDAAPARVFCEFWNDKIRFVGPDADAAPEAVLTAAMLAAGSVTL